MIGTPEGAARRSQKSLVDNMLAEDAYRYDHEAAPPIDRDLMIFGEQDNPSVMDTAFMSPEEHRELSWQAIEENRRRNLESENQPLIPDYPEDYAMAATGVYGVGKGLAQYGLKQLARPRRLQHLKNVVRPDRHAQRSARLHGLEIDPKIEDLFGNMSKSQKAKMAAKHSKPDKFKQAMKLKQDQLNAKLNAKLKKPAIDPDDMLSPEDIAEMKAGMKESPVDMMNDATFDLYDFSYLDDWLQDTLQPFTTFGGQGSNLPVPKWMLAPTKTMRIPPASANSIIPAAVLHESMTNE